MTKHSGDHIFVHAQDRISAESLVYFVSTLSLYYSEVDYVGDDINWDTLTHYLDGDVFGDASQQSSSPILGGNWRLYRSIFQITKLSHNVPLETESLARGQELELELFQFERGLVDIAKLERQDLIQKSCNKHFSTFESRRS